MEQQLMALLGCRSAVHAPAAALSGGHGHLRHMVPVTMQSAAAALATDACAIGVVVPATCELPKLRVAVVAAAGNAVDAAAEPAHGPMCLARHWPALGCTWHADSNVATEAGAVDAAAAGNDQWCW
jgi:hypothetical protein